MKSLADARTELLKAEADLVVAPHDTGALARRIAALLALGRGAEALADQAHLVRLRPEDAAERVRLGRLLSEAGRFDEAVLSFTEALSRDPQNIEALCECANTLRRVGYYERALDCLQHARSYCPDDVRILNNLAVALQDVDRYAEALRCYREALELRDHPMIRANFAQALEESGDAAAALTEARLVLATDPHNIEAQLTISDALLKRGEYAAAWTYAEARLAKPASN